MRDLLRRVLGFLTSAARTRAAAAGAAWNLVAFTLAILTPVACLAQTPSGLTFDQRARPAAPLTRALRLSLRVETGAALAHTVDPSSSRLKVEVKLPDPTPRDRFRSQASATTTKTSGPWWHGVLWGIAGGVGGFWGGAYLGDGIGRLLAIGTGNPLNGIYVFVGALAGAVAGAIVLANVGP